MNEHDPLCPLPYCDYGLPKGECMGYEDCWHHCACHIISAARADEREKAAQRVESCANKFKARDFNDAVDACAAAVRGES